MQRRPALALAILVMSSSAAADHLSATRSEPLREVSHTVDVRIERGVATYVVQRQFKNAGKTAEEVRLQLNMPTGAVATGLRIRAKQRWYSGELLDARVAAERYEKLTGQGVSDPRDPALLYWQWSASQLALQVFPVLPNTTSTVEYTLTVPTRYEHGRYVVTYPRSEWQDPELASLHLVDPVISVRTDAPYLIDAKRVSPKSRNKLRAALETPVDDVDDSQAALSIAPVAIGTWTARLGVAAASDKHVFTRLEVDIAPKLTPLPKRAQVVFVIDASYSAGPELVDAQLAIASAYASHVRDAEIEIVVYRRRAVRVFGAFVPATQLDARITAAQTAGAFALGNGSALDAGAKLASSLLANRTGPRRIVIATDTRVRSDLTADVARAALAIDRDTIVHVVVPEQHGTGLERDDQAALASLATKHHGIYATVRAGVDLDQTALELVRPIRIDQLAITNGFTTDPSIAEGDGLRFFDDRTRAQAPKQVALTGKLWSDPIRLDVSVDARFSQATAGFVFGEEKHNGLARDEMMKIALAGRAVSPVTSYLAIEPGVRPSKIGIDRMVSRGGSGWGTIGSGSYGTIGHGHGRTTPDLRSLVDTTACVAKHSPPSGWKVELAVQTTMAEIVDVSINGGQGRMADCLVETVWAIKLDRQFDQELENFVIELD